jgi:hypothetical protein
VTTGFAQADGNFRYITPGTLLGEFVIQINWTQVTSTVVGPIAISAGQWIQGVGDSELWNADVNANQATSATIALCFSTSPSGPWTPFPYQSGSSEFNEDTLAYGGHESTARMGYISTSTAQAALTAGQGYYFALCGGTSDTTNQNTYAIDSKASFVVY